MTDRATVRRWLDAYVEAWRTYDPARIGALFTEDATYGGPFDEPVRGRDAIVADWLDNRDAPGTYDGAYEPIAVDGDLAVARGHSRYYAADGRTLETEFANIFVLRFAADGRCAEYREWWMERPKEQG